MENDSESIEALINENLRITRESHKLLKKMHRAHLVDVWFRILFLLVAIGAPIFLYQYYLEDYVTSGIATFEELRDDLTAVTELPGKLLQ